MGITHASHFATPNAILTKPHVQPERLYFLVAILLKALSIVIVVSEKYPNNYFIQVKLLFSIVEFSNTVTF